MYLKSIDIIKSPNDNQKVRLIGEVVYDDKTIKPECYWYEISKEHVDFLSRSGNPWLVCLVPLAITLGESLRICAPVNLELLENIKRLKSIWLRWYPMLKNISIETDVGDVNNKILEKTASFFSGGVDSFFTVLKNSAESSGSEFFINDLITVWGFDISLRNPDAFQKKLVGLKKIASILDKKLIPVVTNLRTTLWRKADWGGLSHGCALASVALILERRYKNVLIASSGGYFELCPWGSHVWTDPLLSTKNTLIIHDGAKFNRFEKTEYLSNSEVAMKFLHVCYELNSNENCGRCAKCYRTMMMLDLIGSLKYCATFKASDYNIKNISSLYVDGIFNKFFMKEIRTYALYLGREDMVKAIDDSYRYSKKIKSYLKIANKIEKVLTGKPFVWRWAKTYKELILANKIK